MPNRILRDGILRSARVARLGWADEVFYRRLHSVVDDFGLYYADTGLLRSGCYPRQLSKVSDSDIEKWLRACVDAALVRVYPAQDGERYLQVLDFRQQVRAKESKFPRPPDVCVADAAQTPSIGEASAHLDVFGDVSVDGGEKRATRLPAAWSLPQEWREWALAERPDLDPSLTAAKFADYWHGKGGKDGRKLDWLATWRNWVREERAKKPNPADIARVTAAPAESTEAYLARVEAERRANEKTPEEKAASAEAKRLALSTVKRIAA